MASVNIHCPRCQSAQVYRHGQNPKGHDRFRCRDVGSKARQHWLWLRV
ncbi:Transposase [Shigella dysenteriae 1617]|uniref:Transposase n=1 Tax=Shigella dysenteriae 1617 TaxID=754093 RepID=A0A0A6ZRS7_SHIDY|nr:Transposase [Shigella dysenteriae 1617]